MSEGLGMRYAFLGAFEAAHLNAAGELIIVYMQNNFFTFLYCRN